ncbi:MAG: IS5 family transposase [Puniceicoccales bacterium]|jgi:IS5 family transposase|nr:IS5 family transposase [Puniceicoccales bacterium]
MKPHKKEILHQRELFRTSLDEILNKNHELVILADKMNWQSITKFVDSQHPVHNGAPAKDGRLMAGLHYLKYAFNLSDEAVVARWRENPYWQYFCGEEFFQHDFPIDSSSMSRWRKRIGEEGSEALLKETLTTAINMGFLKVSDVEKLNVDTTVQTKAIRYPTDARLLNRARERLVKEARKCGLKIKQTYARVGKFLLLRQSRYSHAKQVKRATGCIDKLRTILGRIIREVEPQSKNAPEKFLDLLRIAKQLFVQQKDSKDKIYSVHEPDVKCIAKGKAHKKYEFGNKSSVASTNSKNWIVGARDFRGNPYDGHTLGAQIQQVRRLVEGVGKITAYTDQGYRGHGHEGDTIVIDRERRGSMSKREWRRLKRRSAIEPINGHLKSGHRLERNWLKGALGDQNNCILSAAGFNFRKLLRAIFWPLLFFLSKDLPKGFQQFSQLQFPLANSGYGGFSRPTK